MKRHNDKIPVNVRFDNDILSSCLFVGQPDQTKEGFNLADLILELGFLLCQ